MNREQSKYEVVIGLEVHAQLLTESKLFSGDATAFGAEPNTQVSPITLGHPGTLPMMNEKAISHAVKMGLVCHSEIERTNYFARKNYFYPDLPKGYQISQHTTPICKGGYVTIRVKEKRHEHTGSPVFTWKKMPEKVSTMLIRLLPVLTITGQELPWWKLFQNLICTAERKHLPF